MYKTTMTIVQDKYDNCTRQVWQLYKISMTIVQDKYDNCTRQVGQF